MLKIVVDYPKVRALPHNKPIEPTSDGCHVFRVRESRASSAQVLSLRERTIAPTSRLIGTLYGRGGQEKPNTSPNSTK